MSSEPQKNPHYIETFVGLPAFMSPSMLQNAQLSGMLFKADYQKLTALCDKYLNQVGNSEIRYTPLFSSVSVVYANIQQMYSLNSTQYDVGWLKENELSFWLVTVAWKKVGEFYIPDHLAYFLPYLFVDNPYAIATGREVYGFNKLAAGFDIVGDFHAPQMTVNTLIFNPLSHETEGKEDWLFKLTPPTGTGSAVDSTASDKNATQAYQAIVEMFGDVKQLDLSLMEEALGGKIAHLALEIIADLLIHLAGKIPMVFLKQFRSISDSKDVCYQAITESPIKITKFHSFGFLDSGYQLQINQVQSHPIVEALGLEATLENGQWLAASKLGFWTEVDFAVENGYEVAKSPPKKEKIAVLGAGCGSLSAVLGLTETPGWQEKYDITVYQMGWRAGGKGASGRNAAMGDRIEEHGLHIWLGFYENSFRVMQNCYNALSRSSNAPLATWDQAFKTHDYITLKDYHDNQWNNWNLPFPPQPGTPGIGGRQFWPISYILKLIERIITDLPPLMPHIENLESSLVDKIINEVEEVIVGIEAIEKQGKSWLKNHFPHLVSENKTENIDDILLPKGVFQHLNQLGLLQARTKEQTKYPALYSLQLAQRLLTHLDTPEEQLRIKNLSQLQQQQLSRLFSDDDKNLFKSLIDEYDETNPLHEFRSYAIILYFLNHFFDFIKTILKLLLEPLVNETRMIVIMMDLMLTSAKGLFVDLVWIFGYSHIDHLDLRAWLCKHGAMQESAYSAYVRGFYDLTFAYPQGNTGTNEPTTEGNFAAGTAIHAIMLMVFAYKGSIMWKMQAGMGDVVFTPLYQVLRQRGVKFKFFHKITGITANETGDGIESITYDEQVTLKPELTDYNPLVDVKGLPCWPSTPLYGQIEQGVQLKEEGINLESFWTPWQNVKPNCLLKVGEDFDKVICGIPIAALNFISQNLAEKSASWKAMLENVQTVRTLAMQLWIKPNLEQLGWMYPSVVMDAYAQPFNTWADMSQTIKNENWAYNLEPSNIAYFCGPMPDNGDPFPPVSAFNYPETQNIWVKEAAIKWLEDGNVKKIWQYAVNENGSLNWDLLIDPMNRNAKNRFDGQYWRANIDPSERYSLSVAQTQQYRLKTNGSDFKNLYLAGDWIDNGFLNAGCVEATVISGLQAAEALSGISLNIVY